MCLSDFVLKLKEEGRLEKQRQTVASAEAAAAAAEKRLESMVSVEDVQRCEKEAKSSQPLSETNLFHSQMN